MACVGRNRRRDLVYRCGSEFCRVARPHCWPRGVILHWARSDDDLSLPGRVTETAAAATAKRAAANFSIPNISAVANAPLNASPAAVVSTARTGNAGMICGESLAEERYTPRAPIFSTTLSTPAPIRVSATWAGSNSPISSENCAAKNAASVSFGVNQRRR